MPSTSALGKICWAHKSRAAAPTMCTNGELQKGGKASVRGKAVQEMGDVGAGEGKSLADVMHESCK